MDIITGWEEGGITKLYLQPDRLALKTPWPSVHTGTTPSVEDTVFADMDDDGKLDIVSCSEGNTKKTFIQWGKHRNLLNPKGWQQKSLPIAEGMKQWMYAEPLQIDGENGVDLIAAGKGENASIGWLEAPKKRKRLTDWQWHKISDIGWTMSILLKDMEKTSGQIPFSTISGVHNAKYDRVRLLDIDGDEDLDVLICEENYGEESKGLGVIWYENTISN